MKKLLKILLMLLIGVVVLFFIYWGAAILKCEYLTCKYGKHFETGYKETNMIDSVGYFKVLDYSDTSARVYYVSTYKHIYKNKEITNRDGNIISFTKKDEQWVYKSWERFVWSSRKSIDDNDFIWPYIR
ncbi:hypothetical protein LJC10_05715 [Selenomonadales bacterium OttesenSCG-928-I06]|nr:hypothetical protein [Selenomonadales bacterium OttesenSCG-928-I06]